MVTWIVIALVVLAVFVLVLAVAPLLGRLTGLRRAARRLQLRQEQGLRLQQQADVLQSSIAALQQRAELAAQQLEVIRAGRGHADEKPAFLRP